MAQTQLSKIVEPVRHLLEAYADTDVIQRAYFEARGEMPNAERVRYWRRKLGLSRPKWDQVRAAHVPDPDEIEALKIQALVKKYWIPRGGNPTPCTL